MTNAWDGIGWWLVGVLHRNRPGKKRVALKRWMVSLRPMFFLDDVCQWIFIFCKSFIRSEGSLLILSSNGPDRRALWRMAIGFQLNSLVFLTIPAGQSDDVYQK